MDEYHENIVCNFGSLYTSCGFAGDDEPKMVFPSILGHHGQFQTKNNAKLGFIGLEDYEKYGIATDNHIFKDGIVQNWDYFEKLWHHASETMKIAPEEHSWLLTEHLFTPNTQRNKMTQIAFETFCVPNYQIGNDEIFALYASGRTTGHTLCCGHGSTTGVSITEGRIFPFSGVRSVLSGKDVLSELKKQIIETQGVDTDSKLDLSHYSKILKDLAYVYRMRINRPVVFDSSEYMKEYALPDGIIINFGHELFMAPEILFNPTIGGFDEINSLQHVIAESMEVVPHQFREDLYKNIIIEGRTSQILGFSDRLSYELSLETKLSAKIRVVAAPERHYSVWIGQSILASLNSFQPSWISKNDYDETGYKTQDVIAKHHKLEKS